MTQVPEPSPVYDEQGLPIAKIAYEDGETIPPDYYQPAEPTGKEE